LGVLFSTNVQRERGEQTDYAKAVEYFRQALKEEPERVDYATIRARVGQVTPLLSRSERVDQRLQHYSWLQGLDADRLRRLWLPMRPGEAEPNEQTLRSLVRLVDNVKQAEITNIVGDAAQLPEPVAALNRIIAAYPHTPLAEAAREELARRPKQTSETNRTGNN
jgi:hypothetical protein